MVMLFFHPMKTVTLKDFVATYGQTEAANRIGITQASVRAAVMASGENIHLVVDEHGVYHGGYRVSPFPSPVAIERGKRGAA